MNVERYGLYEDPSSHAFAMNPQNGGQWVRWEDFKAVFDLLVEADRCVIWEHNPGVAGGFQERVERFTIDTRNWGNGPTEESADGRDFTPPYEP
jgi:hypothetical protein